MTKADEFSFLQGGPCYRLSRRLGSGYLSVTGCGWRILLLVGFTWLPLVLLALAAGHAVGSRVAIPLIEDPVVYTRFLLVLPLLVVAELVVDASLGVQVRYFLSSGIVAESSRTRFEGALAEVTRIRDAVVPECVILGLALVIVLVMRLVVGTESEHSSWERFGGSVTPAGWWYLLISLPVVGFLLLRWFWIFLLWTWFLFRVSRLELELTPTHPDRAGGLGFLGWGLSSFAIVLMAVSIMLSGSFAREIIHRGASFNDLKYHLAVFVVLAIVVLHAPLLVFTGRLARCRFRGLLDFGSLIGEHDRTFDEKWVMPLEPGRRSLLGSPDVLSLAALAAAFDHVDRMRLIPFDQKALVVVVLAALVPMIPLLGTVVGLTDILSMLGKFMV